MNPMKLSPEKRTRLITVLASIVVVAGGLGFGLIRYQYLYLTHLAEDKQAVEIKLKTIQNAVKHADQIEAELTASAKKLTDLEADVASGDLYSWAINLIRTFKPGYKVEIPQVSPSVGLMDVDLVPAFPYKQTKFDLTVTAHFHDFGHFLANFENQFPHLRVLNLSMEPNPSPTPDETETISFRMQIVALV